MNFVHEKRTAPENGGCGEKERTVGDVRTVVGETGYQTANLKIISKISS